MATHKASARKASEKPVPLQTLYNRLAKTLAEIATHPDVRPGVCNFLMDLSAFATDGKVGKSIARFVKRPR